MVLDNRVCPGPGPGSAWGCWGDSQEHRIEDRDRIERQYCKVRRNTGSLMCTVGRLAYKLAHTGPGLA